MGWEAFMGFKFALAFVMVFAAVGCNKSNSGSSYVADIPGGYQINEAS